MIEAISDEQILSNLATQRTIRQQTRLLSMLMQASATAAMP